MVRSLAIYYYNSILHNRLHSLCGSHLFLILSWCATPTAVGTTKWDFPILIAMKCETVASNAVPDLNNLATINKISNAIFHLARQIRTHTHARTDSYSSIKVRSAFNLMKECRVAELPSADKRYTFRYSIRFIFIFLIFMNRRIRSWHNICMFGNTECKRSFSFSV